MQSIVGRVIVLFLPLSLRAGKPILVKRVIITFTHFTFCL